MTMRIRSVNEPQRPRNSRGTEADAGQRQEASPADALRMHYTSNVKTSMLPPVRVSEDLRNAAESVLTDGESLSGFIQQSVERAIEFRRVRAAFQKRADAALKHYRRTGSSHSADEVVAGLRAKLDSKRKQLRG